MSGSVNKYEVPHQRPWKKYDYSWHVHSSDADKNLKTSNITMSVCRCWDPCVRMWTACTPMVSQSLLGFGRRLEEPFIEWSYLKLLLSYVRHTSVSIDYPMSESVKSTSSPITDHAQKYCYSWDALQFLLMIFCRGPSNVKVRYPTTYHEQSMIIPEACFNFDWSSDAGVCPKVWVNSCYPITGHLQSMIITETYFNFYWLSYGGVCQQVWVVLSHIM